MHRSILSLTMLVAAASAHAQTSLNMSVRSTVPFPSCSTGDVWAIGERYMLVARRGQGFSVVDVADPANPIPYTVTPPGYPVSSATSYGIGDIKSDGRYVYATDEATGAGVFIYDTANSKTNPTFVGGIADWRLSNGVHNCWIQDDFLYCISNGTRRIEVFDVTVKTAPVWVSTLGNGIASAWAHDVVVLGGRAYCSLLNGGFAIYDVADPRNPVLLASHGYTNAFTHNAWPSEDRRHLYTTDENVVSGVGGAVRIWDISNLGAIQQVGNYKIGQTDSVVHNVHVRGDYLFTSWYKEGVRVASIRNDPANPVEIAFYDTFPGNGRGCFGQIFSWGYSYAGAWGVYPFTSQSLFVSDMDAGGFVMRLHPVGHTFTANSTTVSGGGTIQLALDYRNDTTTTIDALGVVVLSALNGQPAFLPLLVDGRVFTAGQASGALPVQIPVPVGLPPLTVDFTAYAGLLEPTFFSGDSVLQIAIR